MEKTKRQQELLEQADRHWHEANKARLAGYRETADQMEQLGNEAYDHAERLIQQQKKRKEQ